MSKLKNMLKKIMAYARYRDRNVSLSFVHCVWNSLRWLTVVDNQIERNSNDDDQYSSLAQSRSQSQPRLRL